MLHWLSHIWNDPISAKEQFQVGLLVMFISLPFILIKIAIDARNRDL